MRTKRKNNFERIRERFYAPDFCHMEMRFNCNKKELTQARITFWVYAICVPIIVFLFILPYLRGIASGFNPFSIVYILIVLYLCYQGYRSLCVLFAIKRSYCIVKDENFSGISTPDPFKKGKHFEIRKSDILGIAKTTVSVGGMRTHSALAVNTKDQKYILFAIENLNELTDSLETSTAN